MALIVASAYLSDEEFLRAVSDCTLPASAFRHGDHLRLAWLLLRRHPFHQALLEVQQSIVRLATAFGAPGLYHETITRAWVSLLATHDEATFSEFLENNEARLNLELLQRFWSPELLTSEAARLDWVPPDRASHAGFCR
jgi:CDP-diacylglycerol--glycerol-3-phosphate 3-phosphatidyltransferase